MTDSGLNLTHELTPQVLALKLTGRMDAENVRHISDEFDRLTSTAMLPVLVDLADVTFMESLGVALLVRLAKRQRERRLGVAVLPGSGPVARILGIARLDRVLNVAFTREAGLQALGIAV